LTHAARDSYPRSKSSHQSDYGEGLTMPVLAQQHAQAVERLPDDGPGTRPITELVGTRGAASMLGITPSAVRKLIRGSRFPAPDALVDGHQAWLHSTVEHYLLKLRRGPGRPRRHLGPPVHGDSPER
jgi:hypothetical protein